MTQEGREGREEGKEEPGGRKGLTGGAKEAIPDEEGQKRAEEEAEQGTPGTPDETPDQDPRDPTPLPGHKPLVPAKGRVGLVTPKTFRRTPSILPRPWDRMQGNRPTYDHQ